MEKRRAKETGSWKNTMPSTTAPTSPDTRPHGIGGTDGQRMHGLCKQQHADDHTGEKARSPQIPLRTRSLFHLTQTECETRLKKSGNNQKKPIHKSCIVRLNNPTGKVIPFPPQPSLHLIRKHRTTLSERYSVPLKRNTNPTMELQEYSTPSTGYRKPRPTGSHPVRYESTGRKGAAYWRPERSKRTSSSSHGGLPEPIFRKGTER